MKQEMVGVDIFVGWSGSNPDEIGKKMEACQTSKLSLSMISNRGVKVYPGGMPETLCTDHWRCRYLSRDDKPLSYSDILALEQVITDAGLDIAKTETLRTFDGKKGFSSGQGE